MGGGQNIRSIQRIFASPVQHFPALCQRGQWASRSPVGMFVRLPHFARATTPARATPPPLYAGAFFQPARCSRRRRTPPPPPCEKHARK